MDWKALCCLPSLEPKLISELKHAFNAIRLGSGFYGNTGELQEHTTLRLQEKQGTLLVVDPESAHSIDQAVTTQASDQGGKVLMVVVIKQNLSRYPYDLKEKLNADALVAVSENRFDVHELLLMFKKYMNNDIFGLDQYIQPLALNESRKIYDTDSKEASLRELIRTLKRLQEGLKRCQITETIKTIPMLVDELLLNGVYNANPRFKKDPPGGPFELDTAEQLDLEWRFDGSYFGFSVVDPFGDFDKQVALNYLAGLYKSSGTRSLGLGIRMSYEQLDRLIINVEPQKRTEVIGLIRLDRTKIQRAQAQTPKSFHYYKVS